MIANTRKIFGAFLGFAKYAWPFFLFAFGFLLSSFPARNPELWGHLAAGREFGSELVSGRSFTPLFDLTAYLGHALGGGFLLVFVKAIVIGFLGVVLFKTVRLPNAGAPVAMVVGLALMALSLRANLQPQTATYLLIGLLMFWLGRTPGLPNRLLPIVCIAGCYWLWANLDRGFVYGLLAFALVGLGRLLDGTVKTGVRKPHFQFLIALAAIVIAVLLNPAQIASLFDPARRGAFPLPYELQAMLLKNGFDTLRSPLAPTYFRSALDNPATLSYYPLLLLCLLGFIGNRKAFRWERFFPSILFAVLSALTDRAIPHFAIVCGPIAAQNLGEAFSRFRAGKAAKPLSPLRRRILAGLQMLLAGLFLLATWPGWLQRAPYEPRRWAYDLPQSPELAAEFLRALPPLGGASTETRTLHLCRESQTALRWFCPTDRGAFDAELVERLVKGDSVDAEMRAGSFDRILLYFPRLELARPALNALLRDRYRWPLLYVRGDAAVFGWRDPSRTDDPFSGRTIDLMQMNDPSWEVGRSPVPFESPIPEPPTFWEAIREPFTKPKPTQSLEREECGLLEMMAGVSKGWLPRANQESWLFEQTAGLIGAASTGQPLMDSIGTTLRFNYVSPPSSDPSMPSALFQTIDAQFGMAVASKDDFLTGALAASIRAGRRAIAENPNDSRAHASLGEAYLKVLFDSRERVWSAGFKQLRELRQAQVVTALNRAIRSSPNPNPQTHLEIAKHFGQIVYLDLSLEQWSAWRKTQPDKPTGKAEIELDKGINKLREQVEKNRARFDKESTGLRVLDQARLAEELNLPGLALDLLLKSDIAVFGSAGLQFQLELMVRTGRAREVIEWTSPEQLDAAGRRSYHWWRAQAFAGLGDYASADAELVEIGGGTLDVIPDPELLKSSVANIVGNDVLGEAPRGFGLPDAIHRARSRSDALNDLRTIELRIKNLAEVSALRGVLALEVGDWNQARKLGEAVLVFSPVHSGGLSPPLRSLGQSLIDRAKPIGK